MVIEIITNNNGSGDWTILRVDKKNYYEGHSIPSFVWARLLKDIGQDVIERSLTDGEMEEMNL